MDIQYYGANCVAISTANARVIVDDNLKSLGLKSVTKPDDVLLYSSLDYVDDTISAKLLVERAGEYEVGDMSIKGVAAKSHLEADDVRNSTIYKFSSKDIDLVVLGNIYPKLTDDELEAIGNVDVLVVPVGGHGYTLDTDGALELIKTLEAKIVVPIHYADPQIKYSVPQTGLDEAINGLAMDVTDTVKKLRVKPTSFTDTTQLFVVERS